MSIVLCAVGDIMIGRSFNRLLENNPAANIWGDTKKVFDTCHLVLGNLETTLSDLPESQKIPNKPGNFHFQLKPHLAGVLREIPFDYLSLANNHILDYQLDGLIDTKKTLKSLDINYSGAGRNKQIARRPAIFKIKTIPKGVDSKFNKIAVFSAANHYQKWKATANSPGVYYIHQDNPDHAIDFFNYYKNKYPKTFIILSFHWSDRSNYEPTLPEWKRTLAKKLLTAGVDLILGHSPHHLQQTEKFGNKYVFYSLGDFIDDYALDAEYRNDIGMIARIKINLKSGNVDSVKNYKTQVSNLQVNLL